MLSAGAGRCAPCHSRSAAKPGRQASFDPMAFPRSPIMGHGTVFRLKGEIVGRDLRLPRPIAHKQMRAGGLGMRSLNKGRASLCALAVAAGGLLAATEASAKYTAIDLGGGGPLLFDGYCEVFDNAAAESVAGEQCGFTESLPFDVHFGGASSSQIQFRSDGTIDFVGQALDSGDSRYSETNQFERLATIHSGLSGQQVVEFGVTNDGVISAHWFSCPNTTNCYQTNGRVLIRPKAAGFEITFSDMRQGGDRGWKTFGPDGSDLDGSRTTFFLPATFNPPVVDGPTTAVPEPATWALMILGLGAAGAALRRRSRTAWALKGV